MTNPIDSYNVASYQNFNQSQDPRVILNLYKDASQRVFLLDEKDPKQKDLLDFFTQKLVQRFRGAHDVDNNPDLRQDLEEFIDNVQKVTKRS